jgi:hypothetical protein
MTHMGCFPPIAHIGRCTREVGSPWGGGWVRPKRSARQLRGSAPGSRDAKALPGARL